ncbi:MAG: hypothetical protein IJI65_00905 [Lachnospiraceae bacterium]|nr:hypothetical protein [Lachnospiraceae bacterium]
MVNFKELKGLNLKSIASLLPGDIFSLGEQDGYVSYFLDRMENGSDLFIAFTVFRNALASRDPVTVDDVCRIIDAYRIVDFLIKAGTEYLTPALYRSLTVEYEQYIKNSMGVIKIAQMNLTMSREASDELKLEKARALKSYYEQRLEYCKAKSEGAETENPSKTTVSDMIAEKSERRGFFNFGRKSKPQTEAAPAVPLETKENTDPVMVNEEMEIPGGFAVPVEDESPVTALTEKKEPDPEPEAAPFVFRPKEDDEGIPAVEETKADDPVFVFKPRDDETEEEAEPEAAPYVFRPKEDDEDDLPVEETPAVESTIQEEKNEEPITPVFKPEPAPVVAPLPATAEKSEPSITTVFNSAFGSKEPDQGVSELEATPTKKASDNDTFSGSSLSFTGYIPCKDMINYSLVFVGNTVYCGRTENIVGNIYDNSDGTLYELIGVSAKDSFVSFMTEDRSETDTAFTEDEKQTMQRYFSFITTVFNENMGKTVTVGEYMRFKRYYNTLVDRMLELEEDKMILYYKALMYADRYLSYVNAYNLDIADGDRETVARMIVDGNVTGITEDFELIKEYHIVDDEAKTNIDEYIHLIEIFPDDEREAEKLPELPAIYKENPIAASQESEPLPPGVAMPVYDNPYNGGYGGYNGQYGVPPYGQQYQQPVPQQTPVQVIVNNNFPGAISNSGTNNQQK